MAALQLQENEKVVFDVQPGSWQIGAYYFWTLGLYGPWRRATHFAVTNHRVILAKRLIAKSQRSLPLEMVQDANVITALGSGVVRVSTAGGVSGLLVLKPMRGADAQKMAETIIQLRNQIRAGHGSPSTPQPAHSSSSDRLRELQRLKTEGLLTDEEYESKRSKLLEEL